MNFSAVRGYNAYAQFSAKIREAVMSRTETADKPSDNEIKQDYSRSMYSEPVDIVNISQSALSASRKFIAPHADKPEQTNSAQEQFKEWAKGANSINGGFSQKVSGSTINKMLSNGALSVGENEEYEISMDVWCAVTVSGRSAEKAKAIQNLLNSTPDGINWGFLLQKLPI
ncbi:MAG: hypothetical protein FWD44_06885 [Oscillospiraceae bacterium]|nr:hypothetical protein [Oscillospiraceae bacterium]